MNYIVLDMEWNQGYPGAGVFIGDSRKILAGEIIQIGAVKLDENFKLLDTYSKLIKPVFYRKMHFKVEQLTGIKRQALSNASAFIEGFSDFINWCGEDHVFLIWGTDDISILKQNLEINKYKDYTVGQWFNLQIIFTSQHESPHDQVSLSTACDVLGIEQDLPLHNALNDALYTARVCEKLDMKKGLEECLEKQRALELNCRRKYRYNDFRCIRDAFEFSSNNDNICPICSSPLVLVYDYQRKHYDQFVAIRRCEQHGHFVDRIDVAKSADNPSVRFKSVKSVQRVKDYDTALLQVTMKRYQRRRRNKPLPKDGKSEN